MEYQFFDSTSQKKCVTINLNGEFDKGKVLHLESDWTLNFLLNAASDRLGVPSLKRIFGADGVEIDDCMMLEDNDILFLSNGDDFIPPTTSANVEMEVGTHGGVETINDTIAGFRIGKKLGRGGFGEVRIGEHHLTGEQVALKFLRKAEIMNMGAAERTTTEIQCLSALNHQHIIRLQQQLDSPHHVVLVLELMQGGDLYHFLRGRQVAAAAATTDGALPSAFRCALPEDEARHVFSQILSAVGFAHNQHICHRDLKLENILLKTKTLQCVKVADFGLSAFYRPGALMKSSCGTLSFLAPEVFAGTSNAGPPLDVWAMGVILFALLCGRLPFEGPDLRGTKRPRDAVIQSRISKGQYKIEESLSPEAKDLVRRLLRVDPAVRASVPETFSHIWLRSSNGGVSFEPPKPVVPAVSTSLTSGVSGVSLATSVAPVAGAGGNNGNSSNHTSPIPSGRSLPGDKDGGQTTAEQSIVEDNVASLSPRSRGGWSRTPPISAPIPIKGETETRKDHEQLSSSISKTLSRSLSKSRSKSSLYGDSDNEREHEYDYLSCLTSLEHVSMDDDEDALYNAVEERSGRILPAPTYDEDLLSPGSHATANTIMLHTGDDGPCLEDTLHVPLPPPSPNRSSLTLAAASSLESSFSNRYSLTNANSIDIEELDEGKVGGDFESQSSQTSPPPTASPFMLVPLRRKEVAKEKASSPRRPRTSCGVEHEEIARYVSSNENFDYDTKDDNFSLGVQFNGHKTSSKFSRQSWTEHGEDHKSKESKGKDNGGSSGNGNGFSDDVNCNSSIPNAPSATDSPRSMSGSGGGKFGSPNVSRAHNKLHIAGSLSLKSHTISSPTSARTRYNNGGASGSGGGGGGSTVPLDGGGVSSPAPTRERGNNVRTTRLSGDALTKGGGAGTPPRVNPKGLGRKVVRNQHGGVGGHII